MNYSDEEKKAIEVLKEFRKTGFHTLNLKYNDRVQTTRHIEIAIDTVLNLIQKQEKIIDKMAEQFYNLYRNVEVVRDSFDMPFGKFLKSKEEVIEYFKKEVEKNER